jgi:hypothetical protein
VRGPAWRGSRVPRGRTSRTESART